MRNGLPRGGFLVAGGSRFGLGELPSREVALAIPAVAAAIESAVVGYTARRRRRAAHAREVAPCASR
jgi:hypothetical protein